jgi:hypothetical protein
MKGENRSQLSFRGSEGMAKQFVTVSLRVGWLGKASVTDATRLRI